MTTGERIKTLRNGRQMSQEELGNAIGVKKAAIHKYENNLVVNLKRSIIDKLAVALNTTPAYLMGWDSTDTTPNKKDNPIRYLHMQPLQSAMVVCEEAIPYTYNTTKRKKDTEGEIAIDAIEFGLLEQYRELDDDFKELLLKDTARLVEIARSRKPEKTSD